LATGRQGSAMEGVHGLAIGRDEGDVGAAAGLDPARRIMRRSDPELNLVGGDAVARPAVVVIEARHTQRLERRVIERLAALHVGDAEGNMIEHRGPQCRDIRAERPWRMRPFFPSLFICFIMRCISICCLSSRFTSETLVPEPVAMRCLREALMSS